MVSAARGSNSSGMDRAVDPASLLLFPERKQPMRSRATDHAGLGGDVKFLRTTEDVRYYKSLDSNLVGMVRAQGGQVTGWGGQQVPLMNSFFGGPTMCGIRYRRLRSARPYTRHHHG
jgi:outer membrane protein assembly factor BamA